MTPHNGGPCPVPPDTPTEIQLRSGLVLRTDGPQYWLWGKAPTPTGGEIVAYRPAGREQEAA